MKPLKAWLGPVEPHYPKVAVGIALTLAGAFTYSSWRFANDAVENEARIRFEFRAVQISEAVRGRMVDYEQVLRGAVGLFVASDFVERDEWRTYVEHLRIENYYPGIQGIGFAVHVPASQKDRHVQSVRAQGFLNYSIQPPGERAEYTSIIYLVPFTNRNLRAFGYDMFSEPVRRAAMERARDSGEPALSGKVRLVQETENDVQAGILMYLPVYRNAMDIATVKQRRAALAGYVYSPFRMNDLMQGILGKIDDVRLRIIDDGPGDDDRVLYDSLPRSASTPWSSAFSSTANLAIRGSSWTLRMNSLSAYEKTIDRKTPRLVAAASGLMSVLVLGIIWLLATLRSRALRIARSMTRELRESREQLALAIEGSGQAMFDWDIASGRVVLSEQWSRITGGGPAARSTTVNELLALVHPEDIEQVRHQSRELVRGTVVAYQVEHRVKTMDGWRWVSSRAKVVERDAAGRALRVAGANLDITERKEIERLKNEFVATVSHELRTPLTALIGALGLLKELAANKLQGDAAVFLGMAQQNSERLATLINDILDLEKIESGRMDMKIGPVAIPALLARAMDLNAPYGGKFNVHYELQAPPDVTVSGDEDRLLQVLTNLMSNAAKFSPAGSVVRISAELRDTAVRIAVADAGPGIPEEFRDRIFGKFAQADGSDTRRKGGTGLGLAISKAIVENLGGAIGYESVAGKGSTFYFDLPRQN